PISSHRRGREPKSAPETPRPERLPCGIELGDVPASGTTLHGWRRGQTERAIETSRDDHLPLGIERDGPYPRRPEIHGPGDLAGGIHVDQEGAAALCIDDLSAKIQLTREAAADKSMASRVDRERGGGLRRRIAEPTAVHVRARRIELGDEG